MDPRTVVARTIRFEGAKRLPRDFPEPFGSDFAWVGMTPSPDRRPRQGVDEWGAVWENIGVCNLGQVADHPLKDWAQFGRLSIPDITEERRWAELPGARARAGDRFLLASGVSIYERVHFIRGLANTWTDIYDAREQLGRLIDVLVEMNLYAIERYAQAGADGYIFCDDWGLQGSLMISPKAWREIWKPRYARIYEAAHHAGLLTLLHSCGYIVDILDDLIEVGLDVIQMDQQENMGLTLLGDRFGGRVTFYSPVDIQQTMAHGTLDEIRAYCRDMVRRLSRPEGGFIPKWYGDPAGAGHRQEAIEAMCDEFLRLSAEHERAQLR
jgi:uroporphyrinogen decarboxylase